MAEPGPSAIRPSCIFHLQDWTSIGSEEGGRKKEGLWWSVIIGRDREIKRDIHVLMLGEVEVEVKWIRSLSLKSVGGHGGVPQTSGKSGLILDRHLARALVPVGTYLGTSDLKHQFTCNLTSNSKTS